jgi:hypothetical protein
MMGVLECELELDAPEERRGRMEDEAILAGVERPPEVANPALVVGFRSSQHVTASEELDPDALGRLASLDIEDVGGE